MSAFRAILLQKSKIKRSRKSRQSRSLDSSAGVSGTTILAAERVGRRARALEIDPRYVDVSIRRWQAFTARDAVHAKTGLNFDQTAADAGKQSCRAPAHTK
jgi:hypothetical protein